MGPKTLKFSMTTLDPTFDNFLRLNCIIKIQHPPYSPDLALCNFLLFDMLKQELTCHANAQSLKKQIKKILSEVDRKDYTKTFHKCLERMQCCINLACFDIWMHIYSFLAHN